MAGLPTLFTRQNLPAWAFVGVGLALGLDLLVNANVPRSLENVMEAMLLGLGVGLLIPARRAASRLVRLAGFLVLLSYLALFLLFYLDRALPAAAAAAAAAAAPGPFWRPVGFLSTLSLALTLNIGLNIGRRPSPTAASLAASSGSRLGRGLLLAGMFLYLVFYTVFGVILGLFALGLWLGSRGLKGENQLSLAMMAVMNIILILILTLRFEMVVWLLLVTTPALFGGLFLGRTPVMRPSEQSEKEVKD